MPGAKRYDEAEPTLNLLQAIADSDKTTTVSDILPFIDALNAVKFNRHHLNHCLQTELVESS